MNTTTTAKPPAKLSDSDLQILAHVHHTNQMEIQAGQLAMKQASSPAVKSYGHLLVEDHQKNDRMVLAFVQKQGQTLPQVQPTSEADKIDMKEAQQAMANLQGLSGPSFDREFLRTQMALHDKTISKVNEDLTKTKDPAVSSMLKDAVPVLQHHEDVARQLLAASANQPSS